MRLKRRKAVVGSIAPVKRGSKDLECSKGCGNVEKVDANTSSVVCHFCVQQIVEPPPAARPPLTPEEKALRVARKLEKVRQREAKRSGLIAGPTGRDLGFVKGWKWKKLFTTALDEHGHPSQQRWFALGVEITQAEYDALQTQLANEAVEKETAPAVKTPKLAATGSYTLIDPNGNEITRSSLMAFFKEFGLYTGHAAKVLGGVKPSYKGWTLPKKAV